MILPHALSRSFLCKFAKKKNLCPTEKIHAHCCSGGKIQEMETTKMSIDNSNTYIF